jgi:hypothetical protein
LLGIARPQLKISETVVVIFSLVVAAISCFYVVFTSPAKNYDEAYIVKEANGFKVTVTGKRISMSHDPISAILRKTHEDSISFILPRNNGVFQSNEVLMQNINKSIGTVVINKRKMRINLFYDDKQKEPSSWNGKYKLIER